MKVREVAGAIEEFAPLGLQESYDNSGLNVGSPDAEVSGVLICVDVTDEVVDEALARAERQVLLMAEKYSGRGCSIRCAGWWAAIRRSASPPDA